MSKRSTRRRDIERLLALRESSGLSLRALADRSGIPAGTLSWWSHRLRREAPKHSFAEVTVDGIESSHVAVADSDLPEIVVRHPDGVSVELRGSAARQVVERVLVRIVEWC